MQAAAPAPHKKTVLIAGGGVGGMQAALTASKRGHRVVLCEKTDSLGGVLLCEEHIPFKSNLSKYLKRQAARVMRAPVELHMNTPVTPDTAESFHPDAIIAAMGARPIVPSIKGITGNKVVGAEAVYYNPRIAGRKVVIIGGGLVGLELGIFLAQSGRSVAVVEMSDRTIASPPFAEEGTSDSMNGLIEFPLGYPLRQGTAIKEEIKKIAGLKIHVSVRALEVTDEGLTVDCGNGVATMEADTIIYAAGQRPLREEALRLADCAPEFCQIGDCLTPRTVYEATSLAHNTALDIGMKGW
jgi:pyruvate/2-oxoglutarate dehydrogenase complex dihydrolipoamide dehydrogenase (E3) component